MNPSNEQLESCQHGFIRFTCSACKAKIERAQPIVLGINEKGEMIWGNIEMPTWQKKMFPIRYTGDFSAFWQKLSLIQTQDIEANLSGVELRAYVPFQFVKKYALKRKHHNGD